MCGPTATPATTPTEKNEELRSILEALKKAKFLPNLLNNDITSVESLASSSFDTLAAALPKMVARSLHSTIEKTYDLYLVLKSKNKTGFYGALVANRIYSLDEFYGTPVEELPMPRMTARVLQKRAQLAIDSRPLRDFLKSIGKEKCINSLVDIGMQTPEDIRDSTMEILSEAVGRMMARLLFKKAQEHCQPDGPDYKAKLSDNTKQAIRTIWKSLQGRSQSFGAAFYELLVALDHDVVPCFAGVSFPTLGREFDHLIDRFISNLDSPKEFEELSDGLVARLMRYKIPCSTLWFGDKAFSLAAIRVAPELDVTQSMEIWEKFYRAILPPLHPTLLMAADMPDTLEWHDLQVDFIDQIKESYARMGYWYLTVWLSSDEHAQFIDDLGRVIETFVSWQKGTGSWAQFEESSPVLFDGMNEEMALEVCILTSQIVIDRYGKDTGRMIGNVLKIVGCTSYGIEKLSHEFREMQKEKVWNQWDDIYGYTSEDFGEIFYDKFTRDPMIKETFRQTPNMAMQRSRFVHQLNATLIRITGGNDAEVRQMLLELGAMHRIAFNVGQREMVSFIEPFTETLKEMLGKTLWRSDTADSWAYVNSVILNYMLVGWTLGVAILDSNPQDKQNLVGRAFDPNLLREFRDDSKSQYQTFFQLFAKETSPGEGSGKASVRYLDTVNRILNEPDATLVRDQLHALGRRHEKYHGVTIETLSSSAKKWMSLAKKSFGNRFTEDVAINWARLWELIATGMSPKYRTALTPSLQELTAPYRSAKQSTDALKPPVRKTIVLTMTEKTVHPHDVCLIRFRSSEPVKMKAGNFTKLRFHLPNGKTLSRYYSAASSPCPLKGTSEELEFLMKEVKGGKVSPFIMRDMTVDDSCELLTVGGSFVLPQPADGTNRLMISAGVGIVAFMSVIRHVVALVEHGLVKKKISLALIHSERNSTFPFLDELLAIWKRFHNHEMFSFDLTLCFTGRKANDESLTTLGMAGARMGRVDCGLLRDIRQKFSDPAELPVYACGPRGFQKIVRETLLKELGHKRSKVHLEFFDL